MSTQITVFEGARCIGGSKIHLQIEDAGIFLDFGMNFGSYGKYFEEFVRPRAARGIHDLWVLNLIPHLEGIYRKDIFPAGFSTKSGKKVQVDAIFVSHAHLDHTGNIGLLKSSIPMYCSGLTATIVKAMQDCGRPALESEVVYTAPRTLKADNEHVITAVKGAACAARPTFIVGAGASRDRLNDFWGSTFSTKKIECACLESGGAGGAPVNFRAFPVDHSIHGATAYIFESPAGPIAYSGDLRLHGIRGELTQKYFDEITRLRPTALIVEGTNIADAQGTSEEEVYRNCLKAAQSASGKLVIADFGPRNIERLQIFLRIAEEVDRKLLVTAKDAFLLYAMHLADPSIPDVLNEPNLGIFDELKALQNKWEKEFIRVQYAHKYVSAKEIAADPATHVLAFSFFDLKHLLDVMPGGGIYIYSTSEAFTEEMEIDVRRLKNWLDFLQVTPVGFNISKHGELEFVKGFHASGHISGSELIEVIKTVSPKILIPVHTERPELFVERLKGEPIEVMLPEEGAPISL